jgi:hypothetical protein
MTGGSGWVCEHSIENSGAIQCGKMFLLATEVSASQEELCFRKLISEFSGVTEKNKEEP